MNTIHRLAFLPALALAGSTSLLGQIFLGTTETFDAVPAVGSWASKVVTGGGDTVDTVGALSEVVNSGANAASSFTAPLGTTTSTGTTSGVARVNTSRSQLEIGPTLIAATLVLATVSNNTGTEQPGFVLSYDLSKSNTTVTEQVPLEVFYSLTGTAGSWIRVPELAGEVGTTAVRKQATVNLGTPWENNASLYVVWADDNANPGADNVYRMDNVTFTAVPEPSTWATFGGLALLGFAAWRRSRHGRPV